MKLDIAIVGYGSAGQAVAVLLERDGHRVQVFERAHRPGPVGAGFLLQPSGLQVLWQLGLLDKVLAHGAPVHRLHGDTPQGRTVLDMRYAALDSRLHGVGLQRGALFELLEDAWEGRASNLHAGIRIDAVDAGAGCLRDAEGRTHGPFDLVIAADGSASRLRHGVSREGGKILDTPYPWGALWCLLPAQGWQWPDELRQRYQAARKMIGFLPVGTRPGDDTRQLSFFWSLPASGFGAWQADGLPAWKAELAALWPQAGEWVAGIDDQALLARANYRDAVLDRWHTGKLVLVGDAAHAMSPQLGQGVNMALLDALALRDALRAQHSVPSALANYQAIRRKHVWIYQFWSRWLTPLFQSDRDAAAWLRDVSLNPASRIPPGKGHVLRVLCGTQRGWFGQLALEEGFIAALQARQAPSRENVAQG